MTKKIIYIFLIVIVQGVEKVSGQNPAVRTVFFAKNSAGLNEKNREILKAIVSECKSGSCSSFKIFGYADKTGSPDKNIQISKARAYAVYNVLLSSLKIDSSKIYLQWMGDSNEVYDLHLPAAHARQRAVDILVYTKKAK